MKSLGLLSQILTVGLSIAIAVLYIKPTFEEINVIQNDMSEYQEQRAKIDKINNDLANHVATVAAVPQTDIARLQTYLPRFVDNIAVMREIQFIVDEAGLIFKDVAYGEQSVNNARQFDEDFSELDPTPYEFSVTAEGTYAQLKNFFSLLEQNQYPLEVHALNINPLEGGFLSADMKLVTYADELVSLEIN